MSSPRSSSPLSVLFVGPTSPESIRLLSALRTAPGWDVEVEAVAGMPEALEALQGKFRDLALVEYPTAAGETAAFLAQLRQLHPKTSVAIVTSGTDDKKAVELMKNGALDYVRYGDLPQIDVAQLLRRVVEVRYLVDQNFELQQVNQMKGEFIANVSHELRTPLSVIIGFAESLKTGSLGPVAPTQVRALESITARAEDLLRTLNQILRIGEGQQRLMLKPLDLRALAVDLSGKPSRQLTKKNMRVETDLPPQPVWVRGDLEKLTIVLENLLSNAIKFGPAGSAVRLCVRTDDGRASVTVSDSGPGVPQEMLPKLFEQFGATLHGPTREHNGLGLGLSLSRRIVEQHSGRIWLESIERQGCTAFVSLPLTQPDSPALAVSGGPNLEKKHVLIVEDNPELVDVLLLFMSAISGNLELSAARSGLEALDQIKNRVPDLMITDVMMPGMDGYELLDRLARSPATAKIPVLVLTGYADAVEKARAKGAKDVLLKPFAREAFCDKVLQLLRQESPAPR